MRSTLSATRPVASSVPTEDLFLCHNLGPLLLLIFAFRLLLHPFLTHPGLHLVVPSPLHTLAVPLALRCPSYPLLPCTVFSAASHPSLTAHRASHLWMIACQRFAIARVRENNECEAVARGRLKFRPTSVNCAPPPRANADLRLLLGSSCSTPSTSSLSPTPATPQDRRIRRTVQHPVTPSPGFPFSTLPALSCTSSSSSYPSRRHLHAAAPSFPPSELWLYLPTLSAYSRCPRTTRRPERADVRALPPRRIGRRASSG